MRYYTASPHLEVWGKALQFPPPKFPPMSGRYNPCFNVLLAKSCILVHAWILFLRMGLFSNMKMYIIGIYVTETYTWNVWKLESAIQHLQPYFFIYRHRRNCEKHKLHKLKLNLTIFIGMNGTKKFFPPEMAMKISASFPPS